MTRADLFNLNFKLLYRVFYCQLVLVYFFLDFTHSILILGLILIIQYFILGDFL